MQQEKEYAFFHKKLHNVHKIQCRLHHKKQFSLTYFFLSKIGSNLHKSTLFNNKKVFF